MNSNQKILFQQVNMITRYKKFQIHALPDVFRISQIRTDTLTRGRKIKTCLHFEILIKVND